MGTEKYDATATSMGGLLKYGTGLPFNRIEKLQAAMRIPLPAATQWDLVKGAAPDLVPAHAELIDQAAQGSGRVEPNSGLGKAIRYMQERWDRLTLFLPVEGVPLDSNITEQALKKAILHRKNALFYKTLNGAHVGDIFMSLIYSAELNGIAPFDYFVALQRHSANVAEPPAD